MCNQQNEMFVIEVNNNYYYGNSYEEIKEFLTNKFGKQISIDFVWDIFNSVGDHYI